MIPEELDARVRRLCGGAGIQASRIEALPGDVGRRRYFRIRGASGETAIAAVYPPGGDDEKRRWTLVAEALGERVRTPKLLGEESGAQLLEDFGEEPLSRRWREQPSSRRRVLERAAGVAAAFAEAADPRVNPPFDAAFFRGEMEKSREAFFTELGGEALSRAEREAHDEFARRLAEELEAHPQRFSHRDFHTDNLHFHGPEIGVIDFQDARSGPDSYDLVSLVAERTTLVEPDDEAVRGAIGAFEAAARPAPGFLERIPRVGLQRAWKAAGTFARACASGKAAAYGSYLRAQTRRVLALLQIGEAEREFAKILRRRSVKLFERD